MASIRNARVIAAVAALPLVAALFTGVAVADNGSFANDGSSSAIAAQYGTGVGGTNAGNSTSTQQVAVGAGASTENNTASVNGSGVTVIDQDNDDVTVNFSDLW